MKGKNKQAKMHNSARSRLFKSARARAAKKREIVQKAGLVLSYGGNDEEDPSRETIDPKTLADLLDGAIESGISVPLFAGEILASWARIKRRSPNSVWYPETDGPQC